MKAHNHSISRILILLMVCAVVLSACGKKNEDDTVFNSLTQVTDGGDASANQNVNIRSISFEPGDNELTIRLAFMYGTLNDSSSNVAKMSSVPQYTAYGLDIPYRFVVKLYNISYWEYDDKDFALPATEQSFLLNMFRTHTDTLTENAANTPIYLYFQLAQNAEYSIIEDKDTLVIHFKVADSVNDAPTYHVISNSYYDLDKLGTDTGLTPSLCDDNMRKLLISKPFPTEAEAQAYKAQIAPSVAKVLPQEDLEVYALNPGKLPSFDSSLNENVLTQNAIISVNGQEKPLPILMPYSSYLASSADGKKMLFSRITSDAVDLQSFVDDDNDDVYLGFESLWIKENNGRAYKIENPGGSGEFNPIASAAFSPDGSKIAICESTQNENSNLHIYDIGNKTLSAISEEGIGGCIGPYTWDSQGMALYIMGGENDNMQIKKYDFTKLEGSRVSSVEENNVMDGGDFQYWNGDLYFVAPHIPDNENDNIYGEIFRLDPDEGTRKEFAVGSRFAISPDGKYMAITESASDESSDMESTVYTSLKIRDMVTEAEEYIVQGVEQNHIEFQWSPDCKTLYYTTAKSVLEGSESDYNYTLNQWDTITHNRVALLDISGPEFKVTYDTGKLILSRLFDSTGSGDNLYATYLLDLSKY